MQINPILKQPLLAHSVARFLIAGSANTLLSLAVYQLLLFWLSYGIAFTLGFFSGVVFSGLVYARYVFASQLTWRRFLSSASYNIFAYGLSLAVLSTLINFAGVHERWAAVLTIAIVLPINFICLRWIAQR